MHWNEICGYLIAKTLMIERGVIPLQSRYGKSPTFHDVKLSNVSQKRGIVNLIFFEDEKTESDY